MSAPYQAVKASDAYFVLGAANQKLWLACAKAVGREDLINDPRFATNSARVENASALINELEPIFATKTAAEWVDILLAAEVPAGPIYNYEQSLGSDHVVERRMVQDIEHPVEGSYKSLGFAVKLSETPQQVRHPPPLLGEHNDEIRRELVQSGLLREPAVRKVSGR
jgi:crotonobetainyl-CoA:carnitine CoA-transferase CaiB-like acyl-CoA transferase